MSERGAAGDLTGRHALVTGGASGIGLACAREFDLRDRNVYLLAFRQAP